jgi:hypothetical protein
VIEVILAWSASTAGRIVGWQHGVLAFMLRVSFEGGLAAREHQPQTQKCQRRTSDQIHPTLDAPVDLLGTSS